MQSEEAYEYLRQQNQTPYIKPQTYGKWKNRSFKNDISKRENMRYDDGNDTYTCHAGRTLHPLYVKRQKSRSGYESEVTVYDTFGVLKNDYDFQRFLLRGKIKV